MSKHTWLLMLSFVLAAPGISQKRYLVSPDEEVFPLLRGEDAASVIHWYDCPAEYVTYTPSCDPYFGIDPPPIQGYFSFRHKDVLGQWYVAKAPGTIDTIFFEVGQIGDWLIDSMAYVRIHRSNIGPDYGPGIRPGPYDPPCQPWGYWINTNDIDRGITAFPEDATDSAWISTYAGPGGPGSTPPIGEPLLSSGGYPVKLEPDGLNFAPVGLLGPISVEAGDRLFISIELSYEFNPFPDEEIPTHFLYCPQTVNTADEYYPSRNWKFYEHEKGPVGCAGLPIDSLKHGWYARGPVSGDSLDVALWNVWYSMTVSGNAPPIVVGQTPLGSTFSVESRQLQAIFEDCYSFNPALAGIASASILYEVDGVQQAPIAMDSIGADTWEGDIPGQPPGSRITYRTTATDLEGVVGTGPIFSYSVVSFGNAWYDLDTGYACTPHDIRSTGTTVDEADFFLPPSAPVTASPGDDGTSGPYDMGGDFYLFNDWFRYAWIGVNGGIALTKSPTDTQDVNSNGLWLDPGEYPWDFPNEQKHGREAWEAGMMPGMFIAPFWADHILQDSSATYGRILTGDDGDSCLFVVQWDSIGDKYDGLPWQDGTTFRVVLDRCAGTVEFQYDETGYRDYYPPWDPETLILVGMQADSNAASGSEPGYVLLSRDGYPVEIRPLDGTCIRMVPTVGFLAASGWNQMAVSMAPLDGDYHQSSLFPGTPRVWTWQVEGGYGGPLEDPILTPGKGFWMKADDPGRIGTRPGTFIANLTIPVREKWNMIGGPSGFVDVHGIVPLPAGPPFGMSDFYGFGETGYYPADFLEPGKGYWVKIDGEVDSLVLVSSAAIPAVARSSMKRMTSSWNSITIRDARGSSQALYLAPDRSVGAEPRSFELPPTPPSGGFDARFSDGTMVVIYPSLPEANREYIYPVTITGARYPVTVTWDIQDPPPGGLRMAPGTGAGSITTAGGDRTPLEGSGSAAIGDPSVRTIVFSLGAGRAVPAGYALEPNYPNPFNASTIVRFSLPLPGKVTLTVYDVLGRAVRTLVDGEREAGVHLARWDGTGDDGSVVPSGVFMLKINAGDFTASRKLLLVK